MPLRVVALTGGVGGARLVAGLAQLVPDLTVVVNTGDDLDHWGLRICPDVDTVVYTLAGLADSARGWGRAGETFAALDAMRRLGAPDWFALGDRDLATHLVRTAALREGERLTSVTARIADALGVRARILPMSDVPRPTQVLTEDGPVAFQDWLVRDRARTPALGVRFGGDPAATPEVLDALAGADVVAIGPSNPYVSIEPILALGGVREALAGRPVVAVSPLRGGRAVKGPLAEMMAARGVVPSARAVAERYEGFLKGMLVEPGDGWETGIAVRETDTLMSDATARERVAREVLALAAEIG